MQICFRDASGNKLKECKDPGWLKSSSRLLLKYTYAHFSKINSVNPHENAPPVYKRDDLSKEIQKVLSRREDYDEVEHSPHGIIVWASTPSQQYSKIGQCAIVRFNNNGVISAGPQIAEQQRQVAAATSIFEFPQFQPFSEVDPYDEYTASREDTFFKFMGTINVGVLPSISLVILGRLHIHNVVKEMIVASDEGAGHMWKAEKLRSKALSMSITDTLQVGHLWASKDKANNAGKNHPYKWQSFFNRSQTLTELLEYHPFGVIGTYSHLKPSDTKITNLTLCMGGLEPMTFARGWHGLKVNGKIDPATYQSFVEHVASFSDSTLFRNNVSDTLSGLEYNQAVKDMWNHEKPLNMCALQVLMIAKLRYTQALVPCYVALHENDRSNEKKISWLVQLRFSKNSFLKCDPTKITK